jgi:hypothetical protein
LGASARLVSARQICPRMCVPSAAWPRRELSIAWPAGEKEISDYFCKFGEIESVEILRGRDKQPRGFGFVIFKKPETVKKLVANRFFEVGNRPVEVGPRLSPPAA